MPTPSARSGKEPSTPSFLWVAGHPALDLLNTVVQEGEDLVDLWRTDADVVTWLREADLLAEPAPPRLRGGALLRAARRLRLVAHAVVEAHSQGRRPDVRELNACLAAARRSLQIEARSADGIMVRARLAGPMPQRLLIPLAETLAHFLASTQPWQIHRCEGHGCILWFHDASQSQRRRWCSMEICGNRAKVAAFRARQPARQ